MRLLKFSWWRHSAAKKKKNSNIFSVQGHRTLKHRSKFILKNLIFFNLKLNGRKLRFKPLYGPKEWHLSGRPRRTYNLLLIIFVSRKIYDVFIDFSKTAFYIIHCYFISFFVENSWRKTGSLIWNWPQKSF